MKTNYIFIVFISLLLCLFSVQQTYGQKPGSYFIVSALGSKYLDVKGGNAAQGTTVQIWDGNRSTAQQWILEPAQNGYFLIKSKLGKYLDVQGGNRAIKTPVHIWTLNRTDAQLWKFVSVGNGFYLIQSKLGTYLDVKGGNNQKGTPVWMYSLNRTDAQKWKLQKTRTETMAGLKMTRFDPKKHGFQFSNTFQSTIGDAGSIKITTSGLCGGMSYAANDYFLSGKKIPPQDYKPAIGTPLHRYIYNRQMTSFENLDKFLEMTVNPFGWRDEEFFYWGLEGTLYKLKESIDQNIPVPLGLFNIHNDPTSHHQVLAIGYNLGGYLGNRDKDPNKNKVRVYIYDPNYPEDVCVLEPRPDAKAYFQYIVTKVGKKYIHKSSTPVKKWRSYFVDEKYQKQIPYINGNEVSSTSTKVKTVLFEIMTGNDDLRGGNDNIDLFVYLKGGKQKVKWCANGKHRWPDNHIQHVEVSLDKPVPLEDITSFKVKGTMSGGFNGDNWNMQYLLIKGIKENGEDEVLYYGVGEEGRPLMRFTGEQKEFTARNNFR